LSTLDESIDRPIDRPIHHALLHHPAMPTPETFVRN
jgi:hypothetical protein